MVRLFEAFMADSRITDAVTGMGDLEQPRFDEVVMELIKLHRPICCFISKKARSRIYSESLGDVTHG